jgi:hypothetical protein
MIESLALSKARRLWGASARVIDHGKNAGGGEGERAMIYAEIERLQRARPKNHELLIAKLRSKLAGQQRYEIGYDDWNAGLNSYVVMGTGDTYEEAFQKAEALQARRDRSRGLAAASRGGPQR